MILAENQTLKKKKSELKKKKPRKLLYCQSCKIPSIPPVQQKDATAYYHNLRFFKHDTDIRDSVY